MFDAVVQVKKVHSVEHAAKHDLADCGRHPLVAKLDLDRHAAPKRVVVPAVLGCQRGLVDFQHTNRFVFKHKVGQMIVQLVAHHLSQEKVDCAAATRLFVLQKVHQVLFDPSRVDQQVDRVDQQQIRLIGYVVRTVF